MSGELAGAVVAAGCAALVLTGGGRGRPAMRQVRAPRTLTLEPLRRVATRARQAARSERCEAQAPEMLDIVTLGLSAGLSFDAALSLYMDREEGPLPEGLAGARAAWEVGDASRSEALAQAAAELGSPAVERFAGAVTEALEFGAPLAATLQRQAHGLREEQRRAAEEAVEKVPVKLLGPLAGLVVPAMLLAILGPLLSGALSMG